MTKCLHSVSQCLRGFFDCYIQSQMNEICRVRFDFEATVSIKTEWVSKLNQDTLQIILLPGHFLWGNSQHVGCKDHFYTTHSPDRPLMLDDFSKTLITFCDNIFELSLPVFQMIIPTRSAHDKYITVKVWLCLGNLSYLVKVIERKQSWEINTVVKVR